MTGFPVFVTAFITESVSEQRSQFILVNSTKPLPKGLIHELACPATPEAVASDPVCFSVDIRRILLERLNFDDDSPMKGRIRTPTTVGGTIKDNSVLKMLSASLRRWSAVSLLRRGGRGRRYRSDAAGPEELLERGRGVVPGGVDESPRGLGWCTAPASGAWGV